MGEGGLTWERPPGLARRRLLAGVLILVALVGGFGVLFVGLQGFPVTERFTLKEAQRIDGRMYLHRLDIDAWEKPPFQVIDDARFGAEGTASAFFIDGRRVTRGRVSAEPLARGDEPGYLHAGLHNFYFSLGASPPEQPALVARYRVRLSPSVTAAGLVSSALIVLAAFGLGMAGTARYGRIAFDGAVIALAAATALAAWLAFVGLQQHQRMEPSEIRALAPVGYLYQFDVGWPLLRIPDSDRDTGLISGRVFEDGVMLGPPVANTTEIRTTGKGAHFMGRGGLLRFSTSDNSDPATNGRSYVVEIRAYLGPFAPLTLGIALILVLAAGFAVDQPGLVRMLLHPRPLTIAVALPLMGVAAVGGYLAWLAWVDALHLFRAPAAADYYVRSEPYRMAGLIRTWPYDALIVGTSVSQNFYMAEASRRLGRPVLNATIAGSRPVEQSALLRAALRDHGASLVIWEHHVTLYNLEPEAPPEDSFPFRLYDGSLLTDLGYAFTLQAWRDAVAARRARLTGEVEPLDPINKWGERRGFGPRLVGMEYCARQDHPAGTLDADDLRENLSRHVRPVVADFPDTEFIFFIPAYSALMHADPGGRLKDTEFAARILFDELGDLPNYRLFDFQGIVRFAGDPELYRDATHYHPDINSYILRSIERGDHEVLRRDLDAHEFDLRARIGRAVADFRAVMDPYCETGDAG